MDMWLGDIQVEGTASARALRWDLWYDEVAQAKGCPSSSHVGNTPLLGCLQLFSYVPGISRFTPVLSLQPSRQPSGAVREDLMLAEHQPAVSGLQIFQASVRNHPNGSLNYLHGHGKHLGGPLPRIQVKSKHLPYLFLVERQGSLGSFKYYIFFLASSTSFLSRRWAITKGLQNSFITPVNQTSFCNTTYMCWGGAHWTEIEWCRSV